MAYNIHTAATRTDPQDNILVITEEEVLTEAIFIRLTEGEVPHTIYLVDDYTEEELEIDTWQEIDEAHIQEAEDIIEAYTELELEKAQKNPYKATQSILEEIL